jgi:ABC-type Mn2+/Zn2+ transport system ATPase subunit
VCSAVEVRNLSVSYEGKNVLENVSFSCAPNQLVGIIGPNGAGKSTLIKAILGLLPIEAGDITIKEKPLKEQRSRIAYVPQHSSIDLNFPVLVEDVVLMGRFPHLAWWRRPEESDYALVKKCLEDVGMLSYRKKQIGKLSGGQLQRVFLARALAQEADILFLDEPLNGIDVSSEKVIVQLLRAMRDAGKTLFVVHHDISKASEYFDSLVLLNKKLVACGISDEVFTTQYLQEAYQGKVAAFGGSECLLVMNS